jgi:hypothetical protein
MSFNPPSSSSCSRSLRHRSRVCPFVLRLFPCVSPPSSSRLSSLLVCHSFTDSSLSQDEIFIHTWRDSTLQEIAKQLETNSTIKQLTKQILSPESELIHSIDSSSSLYSSIDISFSVVYPNSSGSVSLRSIGLLSDSSISSLSLFQAQVEIGDILIIQLHNKGTNNKQTNDRNTELTAEKEV